MCAISNEPEHQLSSLTVEGLRAQMMLVLEERTTQATIRQDGLTHLLEERDHRYAAQFVAFEKAITAAFDAANTAVTKAEIAAEKRFDAVNEFRAQLNDQAATFMPRIEAETRVATVDDKLSELQNASRNALDRLRDMHTTDVALLRAEYQSSVAALRAEALKALESLSTVQASAAGRDHGFGIAWSIGAVLIGILLALYGVSERFIH